MRKSAIWERAVVLRAAPQAAARHECSGCHMASLCRHHRWLGCRGALANVHAQRAPRGRHFGRNGGIHRGEHISRRGRDVVGCKESCHDCNTCGASLHRWRDVVCLEAANGNDGDGRSANNSRKAVDANRLGVFRVGRVHGPHADIIGAGARRRDRLLRCLTRDADDERAPDETAHGGARQVALADVDAVCASGEGDVDAVVHEHGHARRRRGGEGGAHRFEECAALHLFLPAHRPPP